MHVYTIIIPHTTPYTLQVELWGADSIRSCSCRDLCWEAGEISEHFRVWTAMSGGGRERVKVEKGRERVKVEKGRERVKVEERRERVDVEEDES